MKTIEQAAIEWMHNADEPTWEDCFESGAAFAQQWISVYDELPEIDIQVLYKNKTHYGVAFRVHSIDDTVNWNIFQYPDNQITHWRPIELK
ncbi:MAG: DUF551 domain-containing protein [Lentimicrobiaceae bacterium]|nr:DUF551 domain-containing protein [Lentimicrobiaceae bacterium]